MLLLIINYLTVNSIKPFLILITLLFTLELFSQKINQQDSTKNKFKPILPEKGDWVVGINASPFLRFAGNIFTNSSNDSPTFGFTAQHPGSIYFRYFIAENKALRGGVTVGGNYKVQEIPENDNTYNNDKLIESAMSIGVSCGIEKGFVPKKRLRGYFGHEGGFLIIPYRGLSSQLGYTVNGMVKFKDSSSDYNNFVEKGGNTINLFYQGFFGVEYFILPKISVNGEFAIRLNLSAITERKYFPEQGANVTICPASTELNIAPTASGELILNFYF